MDTDIRGAVVGFVAAAAVLSVLVWFVGARQVLSALSMLDPPLVAVIALVAVGWLASWGFALRSVLAALDVPTDAPTSFLLYASAAFANNVTPFGQAGGEPFSALLISRATGTEYENGLAAIASVDTLNFAPSMLLALVGLSYYVAVIAVGDRVLLVLGLVVALAVGVPTAGYLLWRARHRVRQAVVGVLGPLLGWVGRYVPQAPTPSSESLHRRIGAFFGSIERVADDRSALAGALGFSLLGWSCMVASLWLSLFALGHAVPVAAALIAVPVGAVASVTPLPGGLGGVEFAIVLLVVPITGVSADTATAAALVYRGATYWFPTFVGGGALVLLQGRVGR